jgi:Spy/CpxP family protein refolding chaperone
MQVNINLTHFQKERNRKMKTRTMLFLSVALTALLAVSVAIAAEGPAGIPPRGPEGNPGMGQGGPGMGPGGGQRGNRPQMNPEEMMKRRMEQIKTTLQLADDKWTAIEPLVKKVMDLNAELRGGMGRRGMNPDQTPPATTEIGKCTEALRTLIGDAAATEDAVKAKLAELTAAKDKVKAALATAKTDLCKALTAKQQAHLVLMGILD